MELSKNPSFTELVCSVIINTPDLLQKVRNLYSESGPTKDRDMRRRAASELVKGNLAEGIVQFNNKQSYVLHSFLQCGLTLVEWELIEIDLDLYNNEDLYKERPYR